MDPLKINHFDFFGFGENDVRFSGFFGEGGGEEKKAWREV